MTIVSARTRLRLLVAVVAVLCISVVRLASHGFGSTPTWNREISRIVFDKCVSCHRPGGTGFSLMTYLDAQPRANVIKDAVLNRRMPPWGAVKGFGNFRNDQSLSHEQIELIRRWVDGGIRRGNNPRMLPKVPAAPASTTSLPETMQVSGDVTLSHAMTVDGLVPKRVPAGRSIRVTAVLPNGRVEPLVWLHGYDDRYRHPFMFRVPLRLPADTIIKGVPAGAIVGLLAH